MLNTKNIHLTFEDRLIIEKAVTNDATKKDIAATLGKDNSTIGKEIKIHRFQSHKTSLKKDCAIYAHCDNNWQCDNCDSFIPFYCFKRDRSPGVCNGCDHMTSCRHNKFKYSAEKAQKDYQRELINSRAGINMSPEDLKLKAEIIVPLIKKGQSPYVILTTHPELDMTEKTLYKYIEDGVFRSFGLLDIDLRIKTKRKMSKKKTLQYKKRKDRRYLTGRKYEDFKTYKDNHSDCCIVQGDTVYNNVSTGPFLQTFKFIQYGFLFALYHNFKTSQEMVDGLNKLEEILGTDLFKIEVEVYLLDRGSEFVDVEGFEKEENGIKRTQVFYCDPMASGQKGSLENNHKEIRYICPKETDLYANGLTSQEQLNLMLSHINSAPKKSLKGKSPIEMMKFLNLELYKKIESFGIIEIPKDEINLTPTLIKKV